MKAFNSLISQIEVELSGNELPGLNAQLTMAPVARMQEMKNNGSKMVAKKSAILILFYPENNSTKLVMIKRAVNDSVHSGQIAFPGGKYELGDQSLMQTALRETKEEVGIEPKLITIIGSLSTLYIPPSNFDVYPFIGFIKEKPVMRGNFEVERIIEVDLNDLLTSDNVTQKSIRHKFGMLVDVPCFYIQNEIIWGATAMIISELIEVINRKN